MIKDIAFTGYPVSDVSRAREFYEGILGLVPSEEFPPTSESSWLEYVIGSNTLALGSMKEWPPMKGGPTIALEVDDLTAMTTLLKEKNVSFLMEPMDFPGCSMAIIKDPDENLITLHQKKV